MKMSSAGLMVALAAGSVMAEDWPVWRGPSRDGISQESGWKADSASIRWTKELGPGYSTVSVAEGKVYSAGHVDGKDVVYCLSADSGDEIWQYSYPCSTGQFKGPRATPVIDGENLYMVSRDGEVFCLNADDGSLVWKKQVLEASGNGNSRWGIASSAVIHENLLLLSIGDAGTALNKKSGEIIWSSKGPQSYASAVVMEHDGKSLGLFFSAKALQVVDLSSGEKLDSYAWETSYDINGADPLVIGEKIFITSGYGHGSALLDVSSGKLEKIWENDLMCSQFSSCVTLDGYIYGIDGQTKKKGYLRCLSVKDGSERWSMKTGFGSLMAADGNLIVLSERGMLHVAKAAPEKYEEIAQFDTGFGHLCWTSPVLANGTIYCRNDKGTLVAVDVSK